MKKVLIAILFLFSFLSIFALENKVMKIKSQNGKFELTISGQSGQFKPFYRKVNMVLTDSTGTELWRKQALYFGTPAVSNLGECAIPAGERTKTAIDFFNIDGKFIGKFDCRRTRYYLLSTSSSNKQIHTYSFDGQNFCFFTNIEVVKKCQLWFLNNHGIKLWKYELDRYNFPVSVEILKDVVYLKTVKRSFEEKQGKANKYIQVHNFSEETHIIDIETGNRIIE